MCWKCSSLPLMRVVLYNIRFLNINAMMEVFGTACGVTQIAKENKAISSIRMKIKHVLGRIKIFKIVAKRY